MFSFSAVRAFFQGAYSSTSLPLNFVDVAFSKFLNAFSWWRRVVICCSGVSGGGVVGG